MWHEAVHRRRGWAQAGAPGQHCAWPCASMAAQQTREVRQRDQTHLFLCCCRLLLLPPLLLLPLLLLPPPLLLPRPPAAPTPAAAPALPRPALGWGMAVGLRRRNCSLAAGGAACTPLLRLLPLAQ